jgi:hypothetical protein
MGFSRLMSSRAGKSTAWLVLAACVCLVLTLLPALGAGADADGNSAANIDQQLAVPAYIDPAADPGAWTQLSGSQPGTVGIVVANVDSGPDSQAVPAWASAIQQAHAAGSTVLGYVDSGYLGSPIAGYPNGLPTRSGLTGLQAWLPQAEADVNAWYQFYGSSLGGIFFDEGTNQCGPTASSDLYAAEYQALSAYVKQAHPGALTALNPGTAVPQCYEDSADVLVTFEGTYGDYTGTPDSPGDAYQPLNWAPVDPRKIWHIVYATATQAEMEQVMALSKSRNAGYVYVTDDVAPNPYDTIPAAAYWADEQDESHPLGNPGPTPPSVPTGLTVSGQSWSGGSSGDNDSWNGGDNNSWNGGGSSGDNDSGDGGGSTSSTQAQLCWQPSEGVVAPVVAYDLYQGGVWVGSVGAGTDCFTFGGLSPSTSYSLTVAARDAAGNVSDQSQAVTVTTTASNPSPPDAPSGLTVTASSFTTATLAWNPPNAWGQSVSGYVVSQDGAPILTVPASSTTVSVQGLQPGLATYTFSVQALGSTGDISSPSAHVSVTTTPLPNDQEISSPAVQDNADGTITYSANFASPFAFRRVFIQTGTSPCWTTGNASPVCSDYLIENGQLLHYSGTGTDFTFTTVAAVVPTITGTDTYSWTIPAADIGTPAGQVDLFNGEGYSPLSYADPVAVGTASVTGPYPADQAAALSQYVQGAVQQAAVTPSGPAQPIATSPLCPSTPDDTWHLGSTSGCMVGSFSVGLSLVGGLLPGTFTVGITDMVNVSPGTRSWSEQVTLVMQPVSGTVPDYSVSLAPTCSDSCGTAAPAVATLLPGQPVTLAFNWTDAGPATDFVNVATAATLVPQLPALTLPFTPVAQSAALGWSTPVLSCQTSQGWFNGCVFPQVSNYR